MKVPACAANMGVRNARTCIVFNFPVIAACDTFVEWMSGRHESLAVQLRQGMRDTIQKKRQMLCSIVETIILCSRQNIAHRDSGTDLEV